MSFAVSKKDVIQSQFKTEGDVECNLVKPLFTNVLGYADLRWKVRVKMKFGRQEMNKEADLVVYNKNKPCIVVESKKPTENLSDDVISQLNSYARALKCPIGVATNGHKIVVVVYVGVEEMKIVNDEISMLIDKGFEPLKNILHKDVIQAFIKMFNVIPANLNVQKTEKVIIDDYRRFFKKIHNIIRDEEKLDPSESFSVWSKLLFVKYADEEKTKRKSGNSLFSLDVILEKEANGENLNSYLEDRFEDAKQMFPYVFDKKEEKLGLKISTVKKIFEVSQLDKVDLFDGETDVKGKAFEEFLPSQLRGKGLGQFFTPREIVDFMANVSGVSYKDVVVDFSCGSGGFLIGAFKRFLKTVDTIPDHMFTSYFGKTKKEYIQESKSSNFFGIDAEPKAARTAKMNMTIRGDGQNIGYGNGLDIKDFSGKAYAIEEYDKGRGGCTMVLANPPFGSKETDPTILNRYSLGQGRGSQKTEILFIERGIKLLKPEGKMLIVLPEGILTNGSYQYVREYIESCAEIKGVISLPTHTFVQSGVATIKTIVLYLQKFNEEKKDMYDKCALTMSHKDIKLLPEFDYNIFMGIANYIGYMPNGRQYDIGKTDLDELVEDFFLSNSLGDIDSYKIDLLKYAEDNYYEKIGKINDFNTRGTQKKKISYIIKYSQTEDRKDPLYYIFKKNTEKLFSDYVPLGSQIDEVNRILSPNSLSINELEKKYTVLSVVNSGKTEFNYDVIGEDIEQKFCLVEKGEIAFNPYRVNVGSIGLIEINDGLVSPAYVVLKCRDITPEILIELLRTPFYKMYIDVISTGSIRDAVSFDTFAQILIPSKLLSIQNQKNRNIKDLIYGQKAKIENLNNAIEDEKDVLIKELYGLMQK